jgi:hypothetical protein
MVRSPNEVNAELGIGHSVTIRIEDADANCKRAQLAERGLPRKH